MSDILFNAPLDDTIYWEQQDSDMLCAVHAINSLLQYPFFDAVSLSQIAHEIDDLEHSLLPSRFSSSENVGESGSFSVQAMSKALQNYNLSMDYFTQSQDPTLETAFICNYSYHWIPIRKLKDNWFVLNSLEYPQWIGEIYLSAMIQQIMNKGYTVFTVRGIFPLNQGYYDLAPHQLLLSMKDIKRSRNSTQNVPDYEDDLQRAIALSRNEYSGKTGGYDEIELSEEEQLKIAIEMSNEIMKNSSNLH
jgi:hypothetical protein